MAVNLEKDIIDLLNDRNTIKAIASTDRNGNPNLVFREFFTVNEEGRIVYFELIEGSRTNRNLVASIWFEKEVAINVKGKGNTSYQIKGIPVRAIIAGKEFQEKYIEFQKISKDYDLSTIWIIRPEEVIEESFHKRRDEEEKSHPLLRHLDRLTI
ncbi:hypothetical protein ACQPU1_05875 [Clostridium paraputrificum]|uniref:hypothetical protein n=1 Tax=Clostridium paraputrificum TaxID=29363 RepID=UPI003D33FEA8